MRHRYEIVHEHRICCLVRIQCMLYIRSLSRDASLESWLAWPLRLSRWNTDSDPEAHLHLGGRAKSCSRGDGNKRILGEVRQGGAQLGSTLAGQSGFFTLSERHRPPPGAEWGRGRLVRSAGGASGRVCGDDSGSEPQRPPPLRLREHRFPAPPAGGSK